VAHHTNKATVLVVEDEPLIRIFLADALRDAGYAVTEAVTAREAADFLDERDYSAVLTDVTMPGRMNGLDLAQMVCEEHPCTAVIVTSAKDVANDVPKDVSFLRKPYKLSEVLRLMTNLVKN
jgi:DNA-binding NtrC family response regulator